MKWWMLQPGNKPKVKKEWVAGWMDMKHTTYYHQLKTFAEAVKRGVTANTSVEETLEVLPFHPFYDSIQNAKIIDAVYLAAGLSKRGVAQQS